MNEIVQKFKDIIIDELKENNVNCWIAGGCLRDQFLDKNFKDIDLFFENTIEHKNAVDYFISKGAKKIEAGRFGFKFVYKGLMFDLIIKFFPTIKEVLNDFDLTVCMIGIENDSLVFGETTIDDLKQKKLALHNLSNVGNTINRINLHVHLGFKLPLKEIKKLSDFIKHDKEKMIFAQAMFFTLTNKSYSLLYRVCQYLKIKMYFVNN